VLVSVNRYVTGDVCSVTLIFYAMLQNHRTAISFFDVLMYTSRKLIKQKAYLLPNAKLLTQENEDVDDIWKVWKHR